MPVRPQFHLTGISLKYSDGWSDRSDVVQGKEQIAQGGISIRIHSAYVEDFDRHYFQLNPYNNTRNPWFAEFWEQKFQCNLEPLPSRNPSSAAHQPGSASKFSYNKTCTGELESRFATPPRRE